LQQRNYAINFQKEKVQEIKKQLQEQALKEGFKLIMDTGYKGNCFYMICYRGGKKREAEGTGKRSKASAKIGKFLSLSLSL